MSCGVCGRKVAAGSCADGYVPYLSGDYPCPFNPDVLASPRNLRVLPPLASHNARVPSEPELSTDGLEDLL